MSDERTSAEAVDETPTSTRDQGTGTTDQAPGPDADAPPAGFIPAGLARSIAEAGVPRPAAPMPRLIWAPTVAGC